jgi:hypothetical protein
MTEPVAVLLGAGLCFVGTQALKRWGRRSRSLKAELKTFFGSEVRDLPMVSRSFTSVDLPNLQCAIDHYVEVNGARARVLGYTSMQGYFQNDFNSLINGEHFPATVTAAQYREVDTDVECQMRCVENGIHLIDGPEGRIAAHVRTDMMKGGLELEVVATTPERATRFVDQVRTHIAETNVFKGKVISLECQADVPGREGFSHVRFHRFPAVQREDIILPAELLDVLERNTVRFFQHADVLRRSGRSLKRGLLFHGKPGTGKTHTAKWLAQSLNNVTTILISGDQLQLVKECCQLARMLSPSLVIMEDVDLIASERNENRHPAYQVTLHQLLNEMDGLSSNTEVLFLLTTNRPDAIEPAIAARPGRVDQAIEFPLPDADCRRRLLTLYSRGMTLNLDDPEQIIARTEGASPAFIQELVRKAALIAAEKGTSADAPLHVSDACFDMALREMIYGGGELTRQLLGFASAKSSGSSLE